MDSAIHWINHYLLDNVIIIIIIIIIITIIIIIIIIIILTIIIINLNFELCFVDNSISFGSVYLLDSDLSGPSCSKGG